MIIQILNSLFTVELQISILCAMELNFSSEIHF